MAESPGEGMVDRRGNPRAAMAGEDFVAEIFTCFAPAVRFT